MTSFSSRITRDEVKSGVNLRERREERKATTGRLWASGVQSEGMSADGGSSLINVQPDCISAYS